MKTCIWQDGLDIPLVNALEANDYAVYDGKQPLVKPLNFSPITYGCVGLIPVDSSWINLIPLCLNILGQSISSFIRRI